MSKRTSIRALAGRVIESVTIYHGDSEEGPGLSIKCVGGKSFTFSFGATVTPKAECVVYDDVNGNCKNENSRTFQGGEIVITNPYNG